MEKNAYAQYKLAMIYYDGSMGKPMLEEAKHYLLMAQQNGSQKANKMLRSLNIK